MNWNDQFMEVVGAKEEGKEFKTLKERVKTNMEVYKELFGEDPEDSKRIDALNIAFAGFAAAAGDSPNAMQNFGEAGMKFTERAAKTAERRRDRDEKLKMFPLTTILVLVHLQLLYLNPLWLHILH